MCNFLNFITTDINECESNPCPDSGSCVDMVAGYHCLCKRGFSGGLCKYDIDECSPDPCLHGDCTDKVDGYICTCHQGYHGEACSLGRLTQQVFCNQTSGPGI